MEEQSQAVQFLDRCLHSLAGAFQRNAYVFMLLRLSKVLSLGRTRGTLKYVQKRRQAAHAMLGAHRRATLET